MINATLVISVYNKGRELELILEGLERQSYNNYEIIIAEDGKSEEIKQALKKYPGRIKNPVNHITQEDNGFRKNKILNEAIKQSNTDYLLFIDGDCVPHKDFIKNHILNKEVNTVLCGRRTALGDKLSKRLLNGEINISQIEEGNIKIIADSISRKADSTKNAEESIIIKSKLVRNLLSSKETHILGCNFSVNKQMLIDINGFDENYEGPGIGEDSDIEYRLSLTGAKFKSVRNLAIQYHLYHGKTKEERKNFEYFQKIRAAGKAFCANGLIKTGNS